MAPGDDPVLEPKERLEKGTADTNDLSLEMDGMRLLPVSSQGNHGIVERVLRKAQVTLCQPGPFLQLLMDLTDVVPQLTSFGALMDLCERLLSLPFFDSEDATDDFISFLFDCSGVTNTDTLSLLFTLFNLIGHIHPNVCRKLGYSEDWMIKLRTVFLLDTQNSQKSHPAIVFLWSAILTAQELSKDELTTFFDSKCLGLILLRIEKERENEGYSYSLTRMLLLIDSQYETKRRSNPSFVDALLPLLQSKANESKTLSENLIFILNRSEDLVFQRTLINFIRRILSDEALAQSFFYTNDVLVMIDIAIREIRNLGQEQDMLQQAYLALLPGLATLSSIVVSPGSSHKRNDMIKLLKELQGSRFTTEQVKRFVTKELENNEAFSP